MVSGNLSTRLGGIATTRIGATTLAERVPDTDVPLRSYASEPLEVYKRMTGRNTSVNNGMLNRSQPTPTKLSV